MSNNAPGDDPDIGLYIREIVVECSPEDKDKTELLWLTLLIIDRPIRRLNLEKVSPTTWKPKDDVEISIPTHELFLVAYSEGPQAGDRGQIRIDISDLSARALEQNGMQPGRYAKLRFDPSEGSPGLRLSFEVYNSEVKKGLNKRQELTHLEDSNPSDIYGVIQRLKDAVEEFKKTHNEEVISMAIKAYDEAIACLSAGDIRLTKFLHDLAKGHYLHFAAFGHISDINEAISKWQAAAAVTPDGHENLPGLLNNIGTSLCSRFERIGEIEDLSDAIQLQRKAVELTPVGHADLPGRLNNLGNSILCRFEKTREMSDISESIRLQQKAVELTPVGHADLPSRLNNLGSSFLRWFEQTGEMTDISESIRLQQKAVELTPVGRADLPRQLNNLGNSFLRRFERTGEMADISESIRLQQTAVELTPVGHADLPSQLNNLGSSFLRQFERTGEMTDISESIRLQQTAVELTPVGHADLPHWLNNLGHSFLRRFERTGEMTDISESIRLRQTAVELTPVGHADLPSQLNNLGGSFLCQFERTREMSDISESIRLHQTAVELTPVGHADLPHWLNNLGHSFLRRFEQTGEMTDISESIRLRQTAVELTPVGHADLPSQLKNLGGTFLRRFERTGKMTDISESIRLQQTAVELTPVGHADLPGQLNNLGGSFLRHFEHSENLESFDLAVLNFRLSANSHTGSPLISIILHLLSVIAGLDNTVKRRHDLLIDSSQLPIVAAAAALSVNRPDRALEWLEQGRCIVWNQINQLRTPVEDLHAFNPTLADKFTSISKQLEYAGSRIDPRHTEGTLSMGAKISLENEAYNHLKLAKERDEVLASIRNIPGFENFLLPRKCVDLMSTFPEDGPVVIINGDEDRCDALALMHGCDEPLHIPLEQFSYEKARSIAERLRKYLSFLRLRSRYSDEAASNPRAVRRAKQPDPQNTIQELLHTLWTDLVEPILKSLAMTIRDDGNDLPRIWWCPTGPFAFLPIHAAGIYGKGVAKGNCLADFSISSYIPSLSILDKLRSRKNPNTTNHGVLLVSQPDTPNLQPISCTVKEVQRTREELNKRGIRSALYNSKDATARVVLESLESFSCVHLACHASQGTNNPMESSVYLYDKPLTLAEIMKKDLPNADLAFMSACQTSVGDEKLPEEAVHLAAGMLAAGYRSVVATMWSISDEHAPYVAEKFYESLLSKSSDEGGVKLDGGGAAQALHVATRRLREKLGDSDKDLLYWIPYIHVGI
ncbi:CHAT domain-containing protein [Gymnopilus junonius]|uniref:CHAT domain-containing protein n=1 Tax=Gymnopilus junonius TaxID=109634 RepID=A0A9P5N9J6_GYMJU|nr:CHAT domain-containing protein [Gymnopilus junonius]